MARFRYQELRPLIAPDPPPVSSSGLHFQRGSHYCLFIESQFFVIYHRCRHILHRKKVQRGNLYLCYFRKNEFSLAHFRSM